MRKIIQVVTYPTMATVIVLCSDGTLWRQEGKRWIEEDTKQFDHDASPLADHVNFKVPNEAVKIKDRAHGSQ